MPAHSEFARRGLEAGALLVLWLVAIAFFFAPELHHYYPGADDWGLLADSAPGLADPWSWWTRGISTWFQQDELRSTSPYIRPLFNAGYWITGHFAPWDSPARLWLSGAAVAFCAAAAFLALRAQGIPRAGAGLAAAALPLLPGYLPALVMLAPLLAFDPLCAGLVALAVVPYLRRQYGWAALLLFAALLSKENALPAAVAFPLHCFWERSRLPAGDAQRPAPWAAPVLLVPLSLWLALRLLCTEHPFVGDALLGTAGNGWLGRIGSFAQVWPFSGAGSLGGQHPPPHGRLLRALAILADAGVLAGGAVLALRRLWRERRVELAELGLFGSYAYLLLFGSTSRYGSLLLMFLLLALAQWQREPGRLRWLGHAVLAAALLGAAVSARVGWSDWQFMRAQSGPYFELGRQYVAALRALPADAPVILLNDPISCYSHPAAVARVAGLPLRLEKLSDFRGELPGYGSSCTVQLQAAAQPRHYAFTQSCGLEQCNSFAPRDRPFAIELPDLVHAELRPAGAGHWQRLELELRQPATLLYFDPATRRFESLRVP